MHHGNTLKEENGINILQKKKQLDHSMLDRSPMLSAGFPHFNAGSLQEQVIRFTRFITVPFAL
jgi:hypothetical protein